MSLNRAYWDIAEQYYWTPRYIGLESIPKDSWIRGGGRISVPESYAENGRSLYVRKDTLSSLVDRLHSSEEVLNHVFNLTFSVVADDVIRATFLSHLGIHDEGPFTVIGREAGERYGWGKNANVAQQDGFFVSNASAVAIELKLKAPSSAAQIAKYAALLAWEEMVSGPKKELGLLFIVPEETVALHWTKCGLQGPTIDRRFLNRELELPRRIADLFAQQQEVVGSVLDRMRLAVISWATLRSQLIAIQGQLRIIEAGDQTLHRVLNGFIAQLDAHHDTGLDASRSWQPAVSGLHR